MNIHNAVITGIEHTSPFIVVFACINSGML